MIRTKINKQSYCNLCGIFLGEIILVFSLARGIYWVIAGQKEFIFLLFVMWLIMSIIICIAVIVVKDFKYIIINQEQKKIKYYSIFAPFSKTLDFHNYTGKIITSETGSDGSYNVVYLVNKKNMTDFKIMGLHYKNFEEINNAIPLKKNQLLANGWAVFQTLVYGKSKCVKIRQEIRQQENTHIYRTYNKENRYCGGKYWIAVFCFGYDSENYFQTNVENSFINNDTLKLKYLSGTHDAAYPILTSVFKRIK